MYYTYFDQDLLDVPDGTQQAPALMAAINDFAAKGARLIHVGGDLEDEFQIVLAWDKEENSVDG